MDYSKMTEKNDPGHEGMSRERPSSSEENKEDFQRVL